MSNDSLIAFTPERAARTAGVTRRQVDYWRTTFLLEPSVETPVSAHRSVRLYEFGDMVALLTIAELLKRGVPTQRVRRIVDELRAAGHDSPLTTIKYGVVPLKGKREKVYVTLTYADGVTVGADDMGQAVLTETLDIEAIIATVRRSSRRDADDQGHVEQRRGALGSKQVFKGTRVPVSTVAEYLRDGADDDEILLAFPTLGRPDLDAARALAG